MNATCITPTGYGHFGSFPGEWGSGGEWGRNAPDGLCEYI